MKAVVSTCAIALTCLLTAGAALGLTKRSAGPGPASRSQTEPRAAAGRPASQENRHRAGEERAKLKQLDSELEATLEEHRRGTPEQGAETAAESVDTANSRENAAATTSGQPASWRDPGPWPDNRTELERLSRLLTAMIENRGSAAEEKKPGLREPTATAENQPVNAEQSTLGLRVQIELRREFRHAAEADDAWRRLRVEAAEAEGVTPDEYDTNGIRKAHFDRAHEVWQEGNGWKVRSKWFVLVPPKEWTGGRGEAETARDHLDIRMKAIATGLGFPEAEISVTLVPGTEWN